MRWLCALLFSICMVGVAAAQTQQVGIGVLGIFHPREITLSAERDGELLVTAGERTLYVKPRSACSVLLTRASGDAVLLSCAGKELRASAIRASGRNGQVAGLVLAIPEKIRRHYQGILELRASQGELVPVVRMDLETAVASAVQAETLPGTPLEALKAQAIVSRSYFVAAGGRHTDFDFCDLTHCQFLREPPANGSPTADAAAATRGLVLGYEGKAVPAMFTRSCGGQTRTPAEIGLPAANYPYFSVVCDLCSREPFRWTRKVSREDAALLASHGENGRLSIGRRLDWNAVPSDTFTAREQDGEVLLEGVGQGHGVGLCQRGARDLAEHGLDFRAILAHYFPNTTVKELSPLR